MNSTLLAGIGLLIVVAGYWMTKGPPRLAKLGDALGQIGITVFLAACLWLLWGILNNLMFAMTALSMLLLCLYPVRAGLKQGAARALKKVFVSRRR